MRSARPCLIEVSPISPSFNRGSQGYRVDPPPMRVFLPLLLLSLQVSAQAPPNAVGERVILIKPGLND